MSCQLHHGLLAYTLKYGASSLDKGSAVSVDQLVGIDITRFCARHFGDGWIIKLANESIWLRTN